MTDKIAGGAKDAPAAGYGTSESEDISLAQKIKSKVTQSSDKLPQLGSSTSELPIKSTKQKGSKSHSPKQTVSDIPEINSNQTRRLRLDRNSSYGMKVQRPEEDIQSGAYQVLAKPSNLENVEESNKLKLICGDCGEVSEEMRLTCPQCGSYFESTVSDTSFELSKAKARKTQELGVISIEPDLTWQQMTARRVAAKLIDIAIVFSALGVVSASYLSYASRVMVETPSLEPLFTNVTFGVIPGLAILACLIYSASFESSMSQATPGKIAMNITVADKVGQQLVFSKALFRAFITYFPIILALVSIWITKLVNPALESLSQESILGASQIFGIVGALGLIGYGICFSTMPTDKDMRTLGDSMTGTKVSER